MEATAAEVTKAKESAEQVALTHIGQRKVNLIWEYTQATLAIMVIGSNMIAGILSLYAVLFMNRATFDLPESMGNAMMVIITFYYMRTNHVKIGGVGQKSEGETR